MDIRARYGKTIILMIVITLFLILSYLVIRFAPIGFDWQNAYRPAVQLVLQGQSPYHFGRFFNPPWLLIILTPFALLPEKIGFGLYFVVSLIGFSLLA